MQAETPADHSGCLDYATTPKLVRDPLEETKGNKSGELVTTISDDGGKDKRLLVVEPEFAHVLRAADRPGNLLSAVVRDGWDRGDLRTMTKSSPAKAPNSHIATIGHITADELRAELTATDMVNGFAVRFLFNAKKRSKLLQDDLKMDALFIEFHNQCDAASDGDLARGLG